MQRLPLMAPSDPVSSDSPIRIIGCIARSKYGIEISAPGHNCGRAVVSDLGFCDICLAKLKDEGQTLAAQKGA